MAQPVGHFEEVRALAATARHLFVGGTRADPTSAIAIYDHLAEKPAGRIDVGAHVLGLAASSAQLFAACSDGKIRVFGHDGARAYEIDAHRGACTAIALAGERVASAGADGALRVFEGGAKKKEWALSALPLRTVAIDPAGESFAAAGDDGVIRVVREGDERRDMPGHEGPVSAIAFNPSDGRLVSAGEDGTVRIWYLVGAVDFETRTKDDTLHTGGATALAFLPAKDPAQAGERLASVGADGKVRIWRMSERRKPRTLEARGALHALVIVPSPKQGTLGAIVAAGDARTIHAFRLDADGAPSDAKLELEHGFDVLGAMLAAPARASRENAVRTLGPMRERTAIDLLVHTLGHDREPEIRALVASELAANDRREAKKAIRARLDDESAIVRTAALASLRALEADTPLAPLRSALESSHYDTRVAALKLLPPLAASSPLVVGLVASRLADRHAVVRRAALTELIGLSPARAIEPLRIGFERGQPDVRAEVLVRGALSGLAADPAFAPIAGKALDDDDADVRKVAFVVTAIARPSLALWLEEKDEAFARALGDVVRRAADALGKSAGSLPSGIDFDAATVKAVSTVYAQFVHPKHGELAIFRPVLHTPIKAGDKVYLVDIKLVGEGKDAQLRAHGYAMEAPHDANAQLAEVRERLLGRAVSNPPATDSDREPLLSALACRTADTSLRGARGLALVGDMRALGALLTISREPDPALRREAAIALVALRDPRARRRLVWMMNDSEASVRDAALGCFSAVESDPLQVAEAALHSAHEDLRVRGLDVLVREGKGKPAAESLLGDSIEDESPKVRAEAFRTLWSWYASAPLTALDRALAARFPDLRQRAVAELAALSKDGSHPIAGPSLERLGRAIGDRSFEVAKAAYDAALERRGKEDAESHLLAIASAHAPLRAQGARDARRAPVERVRSALMKLLEDTDAAVRIAAIETLDVLLPSEPGAIAVGLQSSHLDLRVRAAELLAVRREEALIDPMRTLLADKELLTRMPPAVIVPLRQRAASALANLGAPRLLKYFATELVKDDDPIVREQAARGLANASRRGEEGYLLDLLGHTEVALRSWAADGLSRLGDARALPVLTGTMRHDHEPIRVGAILSFAALGPEGYGGMLQGLEDPSRDVQRTVLSVILARDLRAFRKSETPDLLTSALSSARPEVRFAAARALELRIGAEHYAAHLVELFMPDKPEKAADMEKWPDEETRARLMLALAEALAGDRPEQRYAAAQALRLRDRPLEYFREIARATQLRSVQAPWVPDTAPRGPAPVEQKKGPLALLRRLFAAGSAEAPASAVSEDEQKRLRLLAFGAYVGLLRHATEDDEAHRVRRDAIERIVELCREGHVSLASTTPALARALDDPNHLVRQAAFAALKKTHANDPETPLSLALGSSSADVVRGALDELAARGESEKLRIVKALDSRVAQARKYAFELLEKLSPPGSLEPLLAALGSEHADIRIGVLERLATSLDPRVAIALGKALESDHDDLRLRAAEMLAARRDDRAADGLGPWLRAEDPAIAERARAALARLGSAAAVRTLAQRLEDDVAEAERAAIAAAIAKTRAGEVAFEALGSLFSDEHASVRAAAFHGGLGALGPRSDAPRVRGKTPPAPRDPKLTKPFLERALRSRHADVRAMAARELDEVDGGAPLLASLFGDRDRTVRTAAAEAYSKQVEKKKAPSEPLGEVLRSGARETMLAAAWGLAHDGVAAALRPLLLFARAGEAPERERALLGLGVLGDPRALEELETIARGGTEEAPVEVPMQAAALEALGRLAPKLTPDDRDRVRDEIDANIGSRELQKAIAAVRALRWLGGDAASRIAAILDQRSGAEAERAQAAKSLGELGDGERAEAALARALDESPDVRWAAREALEKLFPNDRTRVEFLAVESRHADMSEPAASYLATEGDASILLEKLGKLSRAELRTRLVFGLSRRPSVPVAALERLLGEPSATARADAAWVAGVRSGSTETKTLGPALAAAARKAATGYADAARLGRVAERDAEERAWRTSVWAARRIDARGLSEASRWLAAHDTPAGVRLEAAFALRGVDRPALSRALGDGRVAVRSAAAASLAPADPMTLATAPLDPVRLGAASEGAPIGEGSLATPAGRRALLARALRESDLRQLSALAAKKSDAQLDAIAALGRAATDDAISLLTKLAKKDGAKEEDVRKAAFRALRRAQRTKARRERRQEAS